MVPTAPPPFEPIPSDYRDALTGAPLVGGRACDTRLWRTYDTLDDRETGQRGRDLPHAIDSAQSYRLEETTTAAGRRDYQGGKEWTPGAKRFFRGASIASVEEARRLWSEWWDVPYVALQLRREMGAERTDAALCYARGEDIMAVATRFRHTVAWVQRQFSRAKRIVRARLLPHGLKGYLDAYAATLREELGDAGLAVGAETLPTYA